MGKLELFRQFKVTIIDHRRIFLFRRSSKKYFYSGTEPFQARAYDRACVNIRFVFSPTLAKIECGMEREHVQC